MMVRMMMLMRMMRVRRMVRLLMDCLCKSWTARLTPFVFAAFLGLKVGEEAEHLYLDLAELGLGVVMVMTMVMVKVEVKMRAMSFVEANE